MLPEGITPADGAPLTAFIRRRSMNLVAALERPDNVVSRTIRPRSRLPVKRAYVETGIAVDFVTSGPAAHPAGYDLLWRQPVTPTRRREMQRVFARRDRDLCRLEPRSFDAPRASLQPGYEHLPGPGIFRHGELDRTGQ